jgi:hypothetical protein
MDVYHQTEEFLSLLRAGPTAPRPWRFERGRLRRACHADEDHAERLAAIRAALAVASPRAVVGFQTAAELLGIATVPSREVHLVVPAGAPFPQRRGIRAHQSVVPVVDPVDIRGIPCVPAARCAIDLARTLPRLDALPVLDAALRSGACDADHLASELPAHDGLRGVRQVRPLVEFADPRPRCRQESQLRLILHDSGIRGFEPGVPVTDGTGVVLHVIALAHTGLRVGLDYSAKPVERARRAWLEEQGWSMCYLTDRDIDSGGVLGPVVAALRSRRGWA